MFIGRPVEIEEKDEKEGKKEEGKKEGKEGENPDTTINPFLYETIKTADPVTLLILCLEEAKKSLVKATELLKEGKIAEKEKFIEKCFKILFTLSAEVDIEKGRELALMLINSYTAIMKKIISGNENNSHEDLEKATNWIEELIQAWKKVKENGNKIKKENKKEV